MADGTTYVHLILNPQHFMEPVVSIPLSPSLVPILSQINPIHASSSHFLNTHFNIILSPMLSWSLSLKFPHQTPFTHVSSPPYVLHAKPISFLLILSPQKYLARKAHVFTAWSRELLEKLTVPQLFKKFPEFYGNRTFTTAFTRTRHMSLT